MEPIILGAAEVRVLGSLIEKQITTPDYYPLTLNALTLACNQTSNRDPVVSFDESTVVRALDALREKRLALLFDGATSRVPKYAHKFDDTAGLARPEVAALTVLFLRGPQTIGEIRGRTGGGCMNSPPSRRRRPPLHGTGGENAAACGKAAATGGF